MNGPKTQNEMGPKTDLGVQTPDLGPTLFPSLFYCVYFVC